MKVEARSLIEEDLKRFWGGGVVGERGRLVDICV